MTQDEIFYTFQTAMQYGGAFYKKLGECGLVADAENKSLILQTWPRLVSQYGPTSTLYIKWNEQINP